MLHRMIRSCMMASLLLCGLISPAVFLQAEEETEMPEAIDPSIDPEVDAVQEILENNSEDDGIAQMQMMQEEDRQTGAPIPYSDEEKQAYVSSFLLSKIRTGSGQFDNTSDLNGNDSTDENDIVRSEDTVTYIFSYSCAVKEEAEFHTVNGADLHVRYILPCTKDIAEFDLSAMQWLMAEDPSACIREEDGRQILEGYRALPETTEAETSYSIPGAGTLNCVIRVHAASPGTEITPEFEAYLQADEADKLSSGGSLNSTVRISCGTFAYVKLSRINTDAPYGTYGRCYMTDGTSQSITGRLKSFQYEIVAGKQNGSILGVMPLDPQADIHVRYRKDYQAFTKTGSPIPITCGVYDIKTEGSDTAGIRGHTISENNVLHRFYKDGIREYGTISKIGTDAAQHRLEYFEITGLQKTNPGDTLSRGTVILAQQQNQSSDNDRYICSLLISAIYVKGLYQDNTTTINMYVQETFEQNTIYEGLWNTSVHLYSVNAELRNSAYLSGSVGSTSNVIPYRQHFKAAADHTNIPVADAKKEIAFNTWLLWDSRLLEPELFDGKPYLRQTYFASYLGSTSSKLENWKVCYITKKDKSKPYFASEQEMKNCNMMSFDNLCYFNTYEQAVAYAGEITGILVEARNIDYQRLYADNIHTIEIMLQPTEDALEYGSTARFATGTWSWSANVASSMASDSGRGTMPPSANTVQKCDRNPIYTCTRWNGNTIDASSLTSSNQVFYGATLRIDGFQCRTAVQNDDGHATAVKEIHDAGTHTFKVLPEVTSDADTVIPDARMTIDPPAQNGVQAGTISGLKAVYPDGREEELHNGDSLPLSDENGQTGTMDIAWTDANVQISYAGITANQPLPVILVETSQDIKNLSDRYPLVLQAVIDGDARPVSKQNGKQAQASVSFLDLSSWQIRQSVDKAKAEYRDDLTYTVTVRSRSRTDADIQLEWDLPQNGTKDTVLSEEASLTITSAKIVKQDGTETDASIRQGSGVNASFVLPGEESVKLVIQVHAEKLTETDILHASAVMNVQEMPIEANMVETTAEKRIVLPDTGTTERYPERMAAAVLFLCAGLCSRKDRRRRQ